jgi:hypothetical protein
MSLDLGRDLDLKVHRLLFGQTDMKHVPGYSTNFTACLLVEERLAALGWTRIATERDRSLTSVTLRHADGRRVVGQGVDQFEATCKAAIRPEVTRTGRDL